MSGIFPRLLLVVVVMLSPGVGAGAALEDSTFAQSFWGVSYVQLGRVSAFYTGPGDVFHYNRVEGAAAGFGAICRNLPLRVNVLGRVNYGFSDERWKYEAAVVFPVDRRRRVFLGGRVYRLLDYEEDPEIVTTFTESYYTLLNRVAYRNYYLKSGRYAFSLWRPGSGVRIELGGLHERQSSASVQATYSFLDRDKPFPVNPRIEDGVLNAGVLRVYLSTRNTNWMLRRSNGWTLDGEVLHTGSFRSDFDYTLVKGRLTRYQVTTSRGWMAIRMYGGFALRRLPPQKVLDLGGGIPFYRPFGALRGLDYGRFNGDRTLGVILDHHFEGTFSRYLPLPKTAVFSLLEFVVFGGLGWSDMSSRTAAGLIDESARPSDGVYTEAGISLQDRFGIFRWDVGMKANDPGMGRVWTAVSLNY